MSHLSVLSSDSGALKIIALAVLQVKNSVADFNIKEAWQASPEELLMH